MSYEQTLKGLDILDKIARIKLKWSNILQGLLIRNRQEISWSGDQQYIKKLEEGLPSTGDMNRITKNLMMQAQDKPRNFEKVCVHKSTETLKCKTAQII